MILESPTVNFDFSYYLGDGYNEKALGFDLTETSQFTSGFLEAGSGNNFYIVTSDEGQDSTTFASGESYSLIGLGNTYLSDYTVDLSVGAIPTANVSFEASNINSVNGKIFGDQYNEWRMSGELPSIDSEQGLVIPGTEEILIPKNTGDNGPTALRPGDIVLSFPGFDGGASEKGTLTSLAGAEGFHVQSASLSVPLSRTPIERVGSKFPFARVVDLPVNATLTVNAVLNSVEAGNLADIIAGCDTEQTKQVSLLLKSCEQEEVLNWTLKGVTLDSESFSSSIGSNKTVDITFGVQLGGIDDVSKGIVCSGAAKDRAVFG